MLLHGLTKSVTCADSLPNLDQFQTDDIYEVPSDLLNYGAFKQVSSMQLAVVSVVVAADSLGT